MARIYHRPYHGRKKARPGSVHSHVDPPRGWAGFARVRSTWFSTRPLFCQTRNEGLLNHSPIQADTRLHPLFLSLFLPCSAHARKRRGKVVNANARREGGGRRRTALFLDFIQGYILLPFAAKDSARTSRVHFVGRGTSCLFNFFPPLLFLFPRFFPERKNVTFLSSREESWTRMIFLIKEEKMRRRL